MTAVLAARPNRTVISCLMVTMVPMREYIFTFITSSIGHSTRASVTYILRFFDVNEENHQIDSRNLPLILGLTSGKITQIQGQRSVINCGCK